MPHHEHLPVARRRHRVDEGDDVAHHVQGGESRWIGQRRAGGVGVAAEIRGDGAVAVTREEGHLAAPCVPALGEAVEEEDYWAAAEFRHVHGEPIYAQFFVLYFLHFLPCENRKMMLCLLIYIGEAVLAEILPQCLLVTIN